MNDFSIVGFLHGRTGRLGEHARFGGALRVRDGRIHQIGDLEPEPGEEGIDASGCVMAPGFVNTHHHHQLQSRMKSIPATLQGGLDVEALVRDHRALALRLFEAA